jgi:hypothetical protein
MREKVKELFDYRDGKLFWRESRANVKVGAEAGYLRRDGYRQIKVDGKNYYTHRLIFLYHHGYIPEFLDHKDGSRLNNRIENLRPATKSQNNANSKARKSVTGFKGVSANGKRFLARIKKDGRDIYLGTFDTPEEANAAYLTAAKFIHGEFANGGNSE